MDCRKALWLPLGLLVGVGGCQHQVATVPGVAGYPPYTQSAAVPPAPIPLDAPIRKQADLPPKDPSPEACLRFGDFQASEAAYEHSPGTRQRFRETARKAYQQAIRLDPKYVPGYQALARLYVSMEDFDRALLTYEKAVKIKATDASLWYEMGICFNHKRDWDHALEKLAKAVELEPETSKYVDSLGVVLARVGRYQESLDCFTKLGGEAKAHYKLAKTLRHLNQQELSQRHMEVALEMDPRLAEEQAPRKAPGKEPGPAPVQPVVHMSFQPVPAETPRPDPQSRAPDPAGSAEAPSGPGIALPPAPVLSIHYKTSADSGAARGDGEKKD